MSKSVLYLLLSLAALAIVCADNAQAAKGMSNHVHKRSPQTKIVEVEHQQVARDLDADGTTGEGSQVTPGGPTSTSSGSGSSDSSCVPGAPDLSQSGSDVTASYTDHCDGSRKRATHAYSLQRASGSSYSSIYQTSETSWTYVDQGLSAGQSYSYKVCDHSLCGPVTSITVNGGGGSSVQETGAAGTTSSSGLAPWLIGLIVAIVVIVIIAIILMIILIRRQKKQKQDKKAVVSAEIVVPEIVAEEEEVENSESDWWMERGNLEEEKRARAINDLLGEYREHRVLKRKGESSASDSWDDSDEEEWARLTNAAITIQAAWRGYLVRHPRTGPMAASRVEVLSQLVSGFNIDMDDAAMYSLLESMQRASRDIWGDDEVPADIADAINLLALAARNLLSISDKDSEEYKAAEAAFLAQKKMLEERLSLYSSGVSEGRLQRTRSWGAFKNLLREYRSKKDALEGTENAEEAQKKLLEQFRTHCESLLPGDDESTEESEASDSMDSSVSGSSQRSSGSWAEMKTLLQQYRAGRVKEAGPGEDVAVAAASATTGRSSKAMERWAQRASVLEKLEAHLSKGDKQVLGKVQKAPRPQMKHVDIAEAEQNPLEGAAMPWQVRETGSHNVKFAESDSDSESEETTAESESGENSGSSLGSMLRNSLRGMGSPLMRLAPVMFQKRVLRARSDKAVSAEHAAAIASRRRGAGLASDSSGNSSTSPENSSDLSLEDQLDVPAVASEANQKPASDSPRVLRRRVRKSSDGASLSSARTRSSEPVEPATVDTM